jgi:hypothetical protein
METQSVRIAVRSHYGRAIRYLGWVKLATGTGTVTVYFFDLSAWARIYAWSSPVTGKVTVMPHGGEVRSPREPVAHPDARELGA